MEPCVQVFKSLYVFGCGIHLSCWRILTVGLEMALVLEELLIASKMGQENTEEVSFILSTVISTLQLV